MLLKRITDGASSSESGRGELSRGGIRYIRKREIMGERVSDRFTDSWLLSVHNEREKGGWMGITMYHRSPR